MQRSIATVSLSGTLPEKLEAAAAARFDGVEIFENDLVYFDGSPRQVRQMAADLGLDILLFQPFRDFEGAPRDRLQRNLDRAERKFDLMADLGAPAMLVCSNVAADAIADEAVLAEDLRQLAERAARRGLKIGYEALAWGRHVRSWHQAWRIVQRADHPSLGLILDSFHTLSIKDDLTGLDQVPPDRITFVQIADAPIMAMDVLEWSRHYRCFPGQGGFDLASFLAPIVAGGYRGPISLEIFNDGFRAAPPRPNAADGMRSLLYLEETTAAHLAASPAATPSRQRASLFHPPAAARYGGFEFLEFAVDETSGPALASWFETLGFRLAGRHRSKAVTLYRQGAINLALNSEPDSFAHAYFLLHGPSVCAMALTVDDLPGALDRALLYHCQPYAGGVGPNESVIPAICAPDGSLIYFVDQQASPRIYETDFVMEPVTDEPGHLARIDHVAIGLPDGQFDRWLLFYKTALGFVADDTFVVPDPYGLVRSRALHSVGDAVRIPLNISENRNTVLGRSVSSYGGAGVQHIACATDDIRAAVAALRQRGMRFLAIPRNYYDDLASKFGLDEEFLDGLAALDILYDRDADGGEFLQAYSQAFDGRFVVEIVERHAYRQYGAANAPVRLAAQAATAGRSPYGFDELEA
jgi:4-hydroxyphenylpyruvate dioxygenase